MKAIWKGVILAESEETKCLENNHYFPQNTIKREFFEMSTNTSECPWNGTVHYYHIRVGKKLNRDAAWFYPSPKTLASEFKDYVAFWKGVKIEK
ncbi:DUF427 domain-containing protein [Negadavirga shengliensis]|uniref:DUF427 domain-containing protein n=1 Tax=Negadavirga shengliensis TaxID=1389218 RepID=A0ABV9T153_9BACT